MGICHGKIQSFSIDLGIRHFWLWLLSYRRIKNVGCSVSVADLDPIVRMNQFVSEGWPIPDWVFGPVKASNYYRDVFLFLSRLC